ncbi:glycosyltransferase [Salmonirosea aquatica]|uniref:glycosyltransferase n=1 Tax=Salmonirosea aquatica TaxID=2654236 RepID=UPI003570DB8B
MDPERIYPLPVSASLRPELGLKPTNRVILYAGNLGEKQGLEILLEVAERFHSRPEVVFVLVGAGGGREKLEAKVQAAELTNVRFFPLQPNEKLAALLASADVHLVLQKKSASDLVMPSKLTGIMAAGGCAIVTALPGTSLYELVERYQTGILAEPESAEALWAGINRALTSDLAPYRANALAYAKRYLQKEAILTTFEQQLLALTPPAV